jgi:hypothetical protein
MNMLPDGQPHRGDLRGAGVERGDDFAFPQGRDGDDPGVFTATALSRWPDTGRHTDTPFLSFSLAALGGLLGLACAACAACLVE